MGIPFETVSSSQNARLKAVRQVRAGKNRDLVLLEGDKVLADAVASGITPQWALCPSEESASKVQSLLKQFADVAQNPRFRCDIAVCEPHLLKEVSDLETPAGPIAGAFRPHSDLENCLAHACKNSSGELLLAIAGVQDPRNVGAMVRVAAGLGASAVIALKGGASPWHPRALRGASGTTFRIPVIEGVSESEFLSLAMDFGMEVWGATASGDDLSDVASQRKSADKPSPMVLLMGEEGRGLSEQLQKSCTGLVGIPLSRGVESLNVATAAAVLLHAFVGVANQ